MIWWGQRKAEHDFQPAVLTVHDLRQHASKSNDAIFHSTESGGDDKVDHELQDKDRCRSGEGLAKRVDSCASGRGRVSSSAVVQAEVRPIDNYTKSQITDAVSVTGRCTADAMDTVSAMAAELIKTLRREGNPTKLKGRSFDLKSAYRQLAVSDASLKWARFAVFGPAGRTTRCFQQGSLSFGAKVSVVAKVGVVAFLGCARMIQWIAHHLDVATTCYFDDYVCMAPDNIAPSTERSFELLLDLVGWEYDKSGDKSDKMRDEMRAMGVIFDLSSTISSSVTVRNTEKRKQDIAAQIAATLDQSFLSASKAMSLKGRLGFAEGQLCGRAIR